jgi:hypothetical protein
MPTEKDQQNLLKAWGYSTRNGQKTSEQFKSLYNFDPADYPDYYRVNKNDLVVITKKLYDFYMAYSDKIKRNWKSIGIGLTNMN